MAILAYVTFDYSDPFGPIKSVDAGLEWQYRVMFKDSVTGRREVALVQTQVPTDATLPQTLAASTDAVVAEGVNRAFTVPRSGCKFLFTSTNGQ